MLEAKALRTPGKVSLVQGLRPDVVGDWASWVVHARHRDRLESILLEHTTPRRRRTRYQRPRAQEVPSRREAGHRGPRRPQTSSPNRNPSPHLPIAAPAFFLAPWYPSAGSYPG